MKESELQTMVAEYISRAYPDVLFHSDYGSGAKLTYAQAVRQMRQNAGRRGHPDLIIYEPRGLKVGLAIELKREGAPVYKKDGKTPATTHIAEQVDYLKALADRGWATYITVGFENTKQVIDDYLSISWVAP